MRFYSPSLFIYIFFLLLNFAFNLPLSLKWSCHDNRYGLKWSRFIFLEILLLSCLPLPPTSGKWKIKNFHWMLSKFTLFISRFFGLYTFLITSCISPPILLHICAPNDFYYYYYFTLFAQWVSQRIYNILGSGYEARSLIKWRLKHFFFFFIVIFISAKSVKRDISVMTVIGNETVKEICLGRGNEAQ